MSSRVKLTLPPPSLLAIVIDGFTRQLNTEPCLVSTGAKIHTEERNVYA